MNSENCLVCRDINLERLLFGYSRYYSNFFHLVAICQNCGHIQQHPTYSPDELREINDRFFNEHYLKNFQINSFDATRKLKKLDRILKEKIKSGMNVLDIGAGEAWTLEYFQKKNCSYFAVEAVDKLSASIEERGGKVIANDIYDLQKNSTIKFDIIIFRHLLEHLLDPKTALEIVKNQLSSGGLIYLAVPNAERPSIKKGFRTSFIRPVHISYFCETNLRRLCASAGLEAYQLDSGGEIVALLRVGIDNVIFPNCYATQKKIFLSKAKEARTIDGINFLTNSLKALKKRLVD